MTIGTLGGMIMPIVEEATVIPLENSGLYPFLVISGIRTAPTEAVSETEDPEIPPKIILAITLTNPNPPLNRPTNKRLKLINLEVIPPEFMTRPIKTNNGRAIMAYAFIPAYNLAGSIFKSSG
jgi:hypothetical protein